MANYAPIIVILFELCVWLWLPVRLVARFAWLPTFRARRFRYVTPEGEPAVSPREKRPNRLDPAISAALRVARELDTTAHVEEGGFVKLVRLRARFVGDVLEVRARHYPEGVFTMLVLGLLTLPTDLLTGVSFLLLAPPLIVVVTWSRSRLAAHDLVLELLELARPTPTARALALDGDGNLVAPKDPPGLDVLLREAALGRLGGALAALGSLVVLALGLLFTLVGVVTLPIARNPKDTALALVSIVVFGLLALLSFRWIFLGVRRLVRGNPAHERRR